MSYWNRSKGERRDRLETAENTGGSLGLNKFSLATTGNPANQFMVAMWHFADDGDGWFQFHWCVVLVWVMSRQSFIDWLKYVNDFFCSHQHKKKIA